MDGNGDTCQTYGVATGQIKDGMGAEAAVAGGKDGAVADGAVTRGKDGIGTMTKVGGNSPLSWDKERVA